MIKKMFFLKASAIQHETEKANLFCQMSTRIRVDRIQEEERWTMDK